jgi:hypothetical protein
VDGRSSPPAPGNSRDGAAVHLPHASDSRRRQELGPAPHFPTSWSDTHLPCACWCPLPSPEGNSLLEQVRTRPQVSPRTNVPNRHKRQITPHKGGSAGRSASDLSERLMNRCWGQMPRLAGWRCVVRLRCRARPHEPDLGCLSKRTNLVVFVIMACWLEALADRRLWLLAPP